MKRAGWLLAVLALLAIFLCAACAVSKKKSGSATPFVGYNKTSDDDDNDASPVDDDDDDNDDTEDDDNDTGNSTDGVCCMSDGSCVADDLASCLINIGYWDRDRICADNPCELGACCSAGYGCQEINLDRCTDDGGAWHKDALCADNLCQYGACCYAGTCNDFQTEGDCGGGAWANGALCKDEPCAWTGGACCIELDGICTEDTSHAACEGEWHEGQTCNACVFGACCFSYICMGPETDSQCEAEGGVWYMNGDCYNDPCPGADDDMDWSPAMAPFAVQQGQFPNCRYII